MRMCLVVSARRSLKPAAVGTGISFGRSRGSGLLVLNCSDVLLEKARATGFAGQAAQVSGGS
eukprot:SAG11_NODE_4857_length_1745_cov_1.350547_1_plen_61_part_10